MALTLNDIIASAANLSPVPLSEASAYHGHARNLVNRVNEEMASCTDIHRLIGHNPLQIMYDNHAHHAAFMSAVFNIHGYELLARTIPWVYRSYHAHRFSYDYFPAELAAWIRAIKTIAEPSMNNITAVYDWMILNHDTMVQLSQDRPLPSLPVNEEWLERKNAFFAAILNGDHQACLAIADRMIQSDHHVDALYLHIIQPVMYEIGMLWERDEISVALEHLASAIVSRVMATVAEHVYATEKNGLKAVICAAPNEFHEIGARMIADALIQAGWTVRYLGANTPEADLLTLLHEFKPDMLGLSVTMPFNVAKAKTIIQNIKSNDALKRINVCVGGLVFNENHGLWKPLGADLMLGNLGDVLNFSNKFKVH